MQNNTLGSIDTPAVCPRCGKPSSSTVMLDGDGKQYLVPTKYRTNELPEGVWYGDDIGGTKEISAPPGWCCPGCDRVFSPNTKECNYCNG